MHKKSNKLANNFAELICSDLQIINALDYLKSEAIDELQGTFGDYEDSSGMEESSRLLIYAHEKFDWWFNKNLSEIQKLKMLKLSTNDEYFEINISSHRRKNLIFQFLIKLKRTLVNQETFLNVYIECPNIKSEEFKIYAEMFGQLTDDEISQMLMMYQLKR